MTYLPRTKKCRRCGKIKSQDEFYLKSGSPDGLAAQCKKCYKLSIKQHKWGYSLQHNYGIDIVTYELMSKKQKGVCKLCKQSETRKHNNQTDRLSVDHHHTTGKIRGLLCYRCNLLISQFENNLELLKQILEAVPKYLKGDK